MPNMMKTIKLFFIIPIWSYMQTNTRRIWRICGIPVYKIKNKENRKIKYYLLGIRVLMIKRK